MLILRVIQDVSIPPAGICLCLVIPEWCCLTCITFLAHPDSPHSYQSDTGDQAQQAVGKRRLLDGYLCRASVAVRGICRVLRYRAPS